MANKQIFQLDAKATPSLTDVIPLQDAAGSADAKKVTLSSVQSALTGKQDTLGFTPEDVANKSTDGNFAANSDILYPSQKAAKTYADSLAVGLLRDRGNYDASSNLFPSTGGSGAGGAVKAGDLWYISVGGTLGGTSVLVGYSVRALVDSPAQTPTNWSILNVGLGFVPENVANKSTNVNLGTSNTLYPTQNAVKTYVDAKPVPTLDEVLTAGRMSTIVPYITGIEFGAPTGFGALYYSADRFTFGDSLPNNICEIKDGEITIISNGAISGKITSSALSTSRTFNLPDKNGTFAMLDDITTGVEGVTGFGVDNTDPLNPIVNKFTQTLNLTATGTNRTTAAPITTVFTRVNNGIENRGVILPSLTNVGDKYFVYNTTDSVKKLYADADVYVNGSLVDTFVSGVTLLPGTVYSFTCMIGGVITASQEQVTPYLVFRALLTQSGTSAPVLTILENNLQDIPTPSYFSQGNYLITFLNNIYTGSKTFIKIGSTSPAYTDSAAIAYVYGGSGTEIMVNTRAGGGNINDALFNTSLEILVYP